MTDSCRVTDPSLIMAFRAYVNEIKAETVETCAVVKALDSESECVSTQDLADIARQLPSGLLSSELLNMLWSASGQHLAKSHLDLEGCRVMDAKAFIWETGCDTRAYEKKVELDSNIRKLITIAPRLCEPVTDTVPQQPSTPTRATPKSLPPLSPGQIVRT